MKSTAKLTLLAGLSGLLFVVAPTGPLRANESNTLAPVPQSLVGDWALDMTRTMQEHLSMLEQTRPELTAMFNTPAVHAELKAGLKTANGQVQLAITDTVITTTDLKTKMRTEIPYRILGGNAGTIVVEATPANGESQVTSFRLAPGAIAVKTTDCRTSPEECRRAMQQAKAKLRADAAGGSSTDNVIDGLIAEPEAAECRANPEDCSRATRQAMAELGMDFGEDPSTNTAIEELITEPAAEIQWIYFRPLQ